MNKYGICLNQDELDILNRYSERKVESEKQC